VIHAFDELIRSSTLANRTHPVRITTSLAVTGVQLTFDKSHQSLTRLCWKTAVARATCREWIQTVSNMNVKWFIWSVWYWWWWPFRHVVLSC